MGYLFDLIPLIMLFLIISFIVTAVKIIRVRGILAKRRYEGFKIVVDVGDVQFPIGKEVYVFAPDNSKGRPMVAQIPLGVVEEQSGSQVRISLLGSFEWVDGDNIRELIKDGFPSRIYRVGEVLPISFQFKVPMRQSTVNNTNIVNLLQP
ncbi:MAG: hypothetical protein FWE24_06840 [Defluviitaleaceae bacterium]|nr:hypothetical protein [Defluviitaleaceae bacterium]